MTEVTIDFSKETQSLGALQAALYRLVGLAIGTVDEANGRWVCKIEPVPGTTKRPAVEVAILRRKYLELVADENLREKINTKTETMRNVIVALAFGSLVENDTS